MLLTLFCSCLHKEKTDQQLQLNASKNYDKNFVDFVDYKMFKESNLNIKLKLNFTIDSGYHIQPDTVTNSNFIATHFSIEDSETYDVTAVKFDYKPKRWTLDSTTYFKVISENFSIWLTIAPHKASPKSSTTNAILYYQACDAKKCYFPRSLTIPISLE